MLGIRRLNFKEYFIRIAAKNCRWDRTRYCSRGLDSCSPLSRRDKFHRNDGLRQSINGIGITSSRAEKQPIIAKSGLGALSLHLGLCSLVDLASHVKFRQTCGNVPVRPMASA